MRAWRAVLKEIFPIESYDKSISLDLCPLRARQAALHARGMPAAATHLRPAAARVAAPEPRAADRRRGLPGRPAVMMGGGEFIINGAERVVVSQLHRSPGIDFVSEIEAGRSAGLLKLPRDPRAWQLDRGQHHQEGLAITVRIDQSGKFSVVTLLRAMAPSWALDADILKAFYEVTKQKIVDGRSVAKIEGKVAVEDIVYPVGSDRAGEIILEAGHRITKNTAEVICTAGVKSIEVMEPPAKSHLLNALADDVTSSHEEALLRIYQRSAARQSAAAREGADAVRGEVLRHQPLPAGPGGAVPDEPQAGTSTSRGRDDPTPGGPHQRGQVRARLWPIGDQAMYVDDIDHLGNRRLRTIDELAADELRKGFLKLRRTVQERMTTSRTRRT